MPWQEFDAAIFCQIRYCFNDSNDIEWDFQNTFFLLKKINLFSKAMSDSVFDFQWKLTWSVISSKIKIFKTIYLSIFKLYWLTPKDNPYFYQGFERCKCSLIWTQTINRFNTNLMSFPKWNFPKHVRSLSFFVTHNKTIFTSTPSPRSWWWKCRLASFPVRRRRDSVRSWIPQYIRDSFPQNPKKNWIRYFGTD